MLEIPVIETERLILRSHKISDHADSCTLWADPQVVRYIGGKPFTAEEVWHRLLRYQGLWAMLGFGYWAIEEKSTQRFIGDMGFADFKRDLTPSFNGAPEMGWILSPATHGKGYATEAVKAALAWGKTHITATSYVCMIEPENLPSLSVAGKSGFAEYARTNYKGAQMVLFKNHI
jgi:RimJ/RimL family protein N-acetyltransferase